MFPTTAVHALWYIYASQQHLAVDIKGNGGLVLLFPSRSIESVKRIM